MIHRIHLPKPNTDAQQDDDEMPKQISVKLFIYRGNQATLGQRFEEWLEMFDMAVKVDAIKPEKMKTYLLLKIAHGYRKGQPKGR
jgi:hypothetical protein